MKRFFLCIALALILFPIFTTTAAAENFIPTLTRLEPAEASPGQEITVSGMSYYSGTKIVFYALPDIMQKEMIMAKISVMPMGAKLKNIFAPPGLRQTWMKFIFQVPRIESGTYWIRLENSGWSSESLKFTVLPTPPVVNSISPAKGDYYHAIFIYGKEFGNINFVRLAPENEGNAVLILPYSSAPNQLTFYPWLESWWPDIPTGRYRVTIFSFKNGRWLQAAKPKNFSFLNNKPQEP